MWVRSCMSLNLCLALALSPYPSYPPFTSLISQSFLSQYFTPRNRWHFGCNLIAYFVDQLRKFLQEDVKRTSMPSLHWMMGHDVNFAFLARTLEVATATPGYPADLASIFMGALTLELHYVDPVSGVSE